MRGNVLNIGYICIYSESLRCLFFVARRMSLGFEGASFC